MSVARDSKTAQPGSKLQQIAWHWRTHPKCELWLAWYTMVVFYNIFFIVFFIVTRTQPPPKAWWGPERIVEWFDDNRLGLLAGFGVIFFMGPVVIAATALITYSMRRMSVSPAYAYTYLILYSLAAVPGMLLTCITLVVGAMRPERDPTLLATLYDIGFLSFSGTMGIFLIGSVIWAVAILLDENQVLPKWFGYFNICNALTEVVVATCCIYKVGSFAWDGAIAYYINMVVFGIYTGVFITFLKIMIEREDPAMDYVPNRAQRYERPGPK